MTLARVRLPPGDGRPSPPGRRPAVDGQDPAASAAVQAIRTGDTTSLSALLDENPGLANAHIHDSRTPLLVVTDWPGYFPTDRRSSGCSSKPVPIPTLTAAETGPRRRCTGRPAATTPTWRPRSSMAAPTWNGPAGPSAPRSTTRSDTDAGTSPGSWSSAEPGSASSGTPPRSGSCPGWRNYSPQPPPRPRTTSPKRSGKPATAASAAPPNASSPTEPTPARVPATATRPPSRPPRERGTQRDNLITWLQDHLQTT